MKKCPTCQEEFANEFSFCPVDATPLNGAAAPVPAPQSRAAANPSSAASPTGTPAAATSHHYSPASAAIPGHAIPEESVVTAAGVASPNGHEAGDSVNASAGNHPEREEYHLTILEDTSIARRLGREISGVARQSQLTWPEFKRDPFGFTSRLISGYGQLGWKFITSPNVGVAIVAALLIMMTFIGAVVAFDRSVGLQPPEVAINEDLEFQGMVTEIPEEQKKPDPGDAGMNKGDGGGSKPKFERPAGGGGGGREEAKPASFGKLPPAILQPQIVAPDPRPPTIKNPSLPVPATINADPKLFPPDARPLPYGDPKSRSTEVSSGPGTGNGIGQGQGGGVGPGEGGGFGPGRGGNTGGGDMREGGGGAGGGGGGGVFAAKDVSTKASITFKPEPSYTEEARKNNITGTVVLRAVLGANGKVSGITPVQRLPYGLTEKAIAAAQQIRFTPATKDGRPVGMYVRIEYNFNMY
ncbi:MAG TPA: energy transducer TonB [Pyrinomonadaceae bacterium]|nr:energy transducer TonB [Pyrinomonadaceae bacterium]